MGVAIHEVAETDAKKKQTPEDRGHERQRDKCPPQPVPLLCCVHDERCRVLGRRDARVLDNRVGIAPCRIVFGGD
jgi:hypothetical protein